MWLCKSSRERTRAAAALSNENPCHVLTNTRQSIASFSSSHPNHHLQTLLPLDNHLLASDSYSFASPQSVTMWRCLMALILTWVTYLRATWPTRLLRPCSIATRSPETQKVLVLLKVRVCDPAWTWGNQYPSFFFFSTHFPPPLLFFLIPFFQHLLPLGK